MRVIIAGGGTGGHVIPALAVAGELRRRGHADILMVGSARGIEARLAPQHGVPLVLLEVGALKRVGLLRQLATALRLPLNFAQAGRILDDFRPDLVYGVGGYASGPVLLMAAAKGVPIVVHEPNAMPGFSNRVIAPVVSRALVAFPEAARFFPSTRVEVVGVPVREAFFRVPPKEHQPPYTVLVFGGSQGARRINQAAVECLPLFAECGPPVRFVHQTGEKEYDSVRAAYRERGLEDQAEVLPFIDDMPAAFARADVLVCRSGASTLAEAAAAGKAAVLAPLPFAADDHQRKNAESFQRAGAARLLLDAELNGRRLYETIRELLPCLSELEENARRLAKPEALTKIAETLERTGRHVL